MIRRVNGSYNQNHEDFQYKFLGILVLIAMIILMLSFSFLMISYGIHLLHG